MTPTSTDRIPKQCTFERKKLPPIVVNFEGGMVTSDAGLSLIAELDQKLQITSQLSQCFQDYRDPNLGCFYTRYMDDWVVLTNTRWQLRRVVKCRGQGSREAGGK